MKILSIASRVTHRELNIVIRYASCLMHNGYFDEARKELRKISNIISSISNWLIDIMVAGNDLVSDEYSTIMLIPKIKNH